MNLQIWWGQIDWDATGSMLSGWGTLIGAVAVFYAAKKGAETFNSWKQQKIAEHRREQAERILIATYKAQQAITHVRREMMQPDELSAAASRLKDLDPEWAKVDESVWRRRVTVSAYCARIDKTWDDLLELENCLPMARALLGEECENAIKKFIDQFSQVEDDANSYYRAGVQDTEYTKGLYENMYFRRGRTNKVTDAVVEAVKKIREICEPALQLEFEPKKVHSHKQIP